MEDVRVYVRPGTTDHHYVLSFLRPKEIPVKELSEKHISVDGNAALLEIRPVYGHGKRGKTRLVGYNVPAGDQSDYSTLTDAFSATKRWLSDVLGQHGYEVWFD